MFTIYKGTIDVAVSCNTEINFFNKESSFAPYLLLRDGVRINSLTIHESVLCRLVHNRNKIIEKIVAREQHLICGLCYDLCVMNNCSFEHIKKPGSAKINF
ncbi:hypothetical protein RF11_10892 [Thelohanellus kitauei]|uniref:Uncharacterized protein n=1 Tax=Thelohanellus kitauei TaxID=669202 RepID=A0A0C2J5S1_THEKT|nr:hypothetical protein RF11_10892 [Thelohanellus kitauei]